ncbi:hypothetical protein Taro_004823 [Colocasia esculenta]|uniref:Uncharacterized protein n=1 Tax=Colocasia esculenta TaxID=4460 RepID=A0A843TN49_COLES|nr:hypothetical protein [Colocasia esculenta]
MWTFRVAVVLGGRGVDANLRILQVIGSPEGRFLVSRTMVLVCSVLGEFPTEPVTSEAHPYPHRLRPVRGRRTRIKYVIGLTGLAEAFRHSWYQSKKSLVWMIEEIGVVEEMIQRKVPSI